MIKKLLAFTLLALAYIPANAAYLCPETSLGYRAILVDTLLTIERNSETLLWKFKEKRGNTELFTLNGNVIQIQRTHEGFFSIESDGTRVKHSKCAIQ